MSDRLEAILADAVPRVCPAAVALISVDGDVAATAAAGELVRYADADGTLADERPPVRVDSVFDLASVSKLFTTVALLSLTEEGLLDLDEPVAARFPWHLSCVDPRITPRRLLTHTAGLPPGRRIDRELPDAGFEERMAAMTRTPVSHPLGGPYLYSDVGMIIAGRTAELAGDAPLDALVEARVTAPLALTDTGYRPDTLGRATTPTTKAPEPGTTGRPTTPTTKTPEPGSGGQEALGRGAARYRPAALERIAATEWKPGRPGPGCVRGEVHDETAYALGGVAGHAGVFGTAGDLLAFGEALRRGTAQDGPMLRRETLAEMLRDQGTEGAPFRHGLGVRLGDPGIAGPLECAFGHSGFTGTSLVVDPVRRLTVVLLTNAVHPVRGRDGIRALRVAVATEAARLAA
ncbi:CubicO group peptidase, beta-lactamase class C family [Nonomuraea maritima]|uniref:CubicO group peptidase, beta-lactamase class C family n=1 Tax=Nonomuraea maritima TaxID=683260 RepID=A0A1G8WA18_9ACTN|nr:serine hydrolase domain-containing protein [Nonomuraea maritima]SDJ75114.1 CubicO group peptidase, beta-lactamase class C family [Nonomuraea maritima]